MDPKWIFEAIHQSTFSQWLQTTRWGLASIEMFHLVGLSVFGGVLLLHHGRVLWPKRGDGIEVPLLYRLSLLTMVLTGLLLVAAEPMKCYEHPAFRWKMLLFAAALVLEPWLGKASNRWASATSLTLWTSVGFFGRAIGFY